MSTLEIVSFVITLLAIFGFVVVIWLWGPKKPKGIPSPLNIPPPPRLTDLEVLTLKVGRLDGIITEQGKDIWKLENPPKHEVGDTVWEKKNHDDSPLLITDIQFKESHDEPFHDEYGSFHRIVFQHWVYTVFNKEEKYTESFHEKDLRTCEKPKP